MTLGTWYYRECVATRPFDYEIAPHGTADVLATLAWPAAFCLALLGATTLLAAPPELSALLGALLWPASLFLLAPSAAEGLVLSDAPHAAGTAQLLFTAAGLLIAFAISHAVDAARSERKLAISIQEVLSRAAVPYAVLAAILAGAAFLGGTQSVLMISHCALLVAFVPCLWLSVTCDPYKWSGFSAVVTWTGWIALLGVGQAAEWVAVGHGALPH